MKKVLRVLLLILIFSTFLTACRDKKENNKPAIVGSWKYESGSYTYTFNEDGTGKYDISGSVKEFTYKTDGDKLSITYNGSTAAFETTYEIKDNVLNIKDSFGKDTKYKKVN